MYFSRRYQENVVLLSESILNLLLGVFHPKVAFTTSRHINPTAAGVLRHAPLAGGGALNAPSP